jgi:beta-lactam-binding protein with PASTA domain
MLIFKGLDVYTHHGEEVIVPEVKGMMPNQAERLFRDRGLIAKVVSTSYRKDMPSGCILELTPESGEKVKKGRIIFLTINSIDAPLREVPDVTENSSAREAEAQLLTAGFHLTPNQLIKGEMDWVYGVLYNGRKIISGEKIPVGSILTLQIGNGDVESDDQDSSSIAADGSIVLNEEGVEGENVLPEANTTKPEQTKASASVKENNNGTKKTQKRENIKPRVEKTQKKPQPAKKTPAKKTHKNDNSNESWF